MDGDVEVSLTEDGNGLSRTGPSRRGRATAGQGGWNQFGGRGVMHPAGGDGVGYRKDRRRHDPFVWKQAGLGEERRGDRTVDC